MDSFIKQERDQHGGHPFHENLKQEHPHDVYQEQSLTSSRSLSDFIKEEPNDVKQDDPDHNGEHVMSSNYLLAVIKEELILECAKNEATVEMSCTSDGYDETPTKGGAQQPSAGFIQTMPYKQESINEQNTSMASCSNEKKIVEFSVGPPNPECFICYDCGKNFSRKNTLARHFIANHARLWCCVTCQKRFSSNPCLRRHFLIHTGEKPYTCVDCGMSFNRKSNLISHTRTHTGEKPYGCGECGKRFTQRSSLIKHSRIHTGEKPYPCGECGKRFSERSNLNKHSRIHTGEMSYPCGECRKRFTVRSHLIKHTRIHTGDKLYPYGVCGKRFTQRSNLIRHTRIHTGKKPYTCVDCGKSFSYKHVLTKHSRIHIRGKPFSCVNCNISFAYKHELSQHAKSQACKGIESNIASEKCVIKKRKSLSHAVAASCSKQGQACLRSHLALSSPIPAKYDILACRVVLKRLTIESLTSVTVTL